MTKKTKKAANQYVVAISDIYGLNWLYGPYASRAKAFKVGLKKVKAFSAVKENTKRGQKLVEKFSKGLQNGRVEFIAEGWNGSDMPHVAQIELLDNE